MNVDKSIYKLVVSHFSRIQKLNSIVWFLVFGVVASISNVAVIGQDTQDAEEQERFEKFEKLLNNVKLVGSFTVIGDDDKTLKEEEYTIEKVTKLEKGNQWEIKARIKFGKYDFSAPLNLDVEWAGDTPVITLTDLTIPTLGTFSSRVLFYNGKYAGTWTHDDHGGHLFGRIVPIDEAETGDDSSNQKSKKDSDKPKSDGDDVDDDDDDDDDGE